MKFEKNDLGLTLIFGDMGPMKYEKIMILG